MCFFGYNRVREENKIRITNNWATIYKIQNVLSNYTSKKLISTWCVWKWGALNIIDQLRIVSSWKLCF